MLYSATLCYGILHYTTLHYTMLHYTILYYYYTILYYTILYYTILYYTILYYTILYCTINKGSLRFHLVISSFMIFLYWHDKLLGCGGDYMDMYWVSNTVRRKFFLLLFEKGGDPIECLLYCTLKMISIGLKMTVYGRNMMP